MSRKEHREKYWDGKDKSEYECPECERGIEEVKEFQVHHIDGDPTNGTEENLIGLCKECHHENHGPFTDQYRSGYSNKFVGVL